MANEVTQRTLTIIEKESNDPVAVFSEQDGQIECVGGDPQIVEILGLSEMTSLDEMFQHINSDEEDSGYQAVVEGEPEQEEQENEDDSVKAAIEILKNLINEVKEKRAQDASVKQAESPEGQMEAATGAEVMPDLSKIVYVSFDGDSIGNKVAQAEERDDEQYLAEVSSRINQGQVIFQQWLTKGSGSVVEAGGDEGLGKVRAEHLANIEEFRQEYFDVVGATVTVGVGSKISEATKARMLGKLRGKNQVCTFDDSTIQELELRMKDQDQGEATKMRTAMRPAADPEVAPASTPEQAPQQASEEPQAPQGKPMVVHSADEEESRGGGNYDEFGYRRN